MIKLNARLERLEQQIDDAGQIAFGALIDTLIESERDAILEARNAGGVTDGFRRAIERTFDKLDPTVARDLIAWYETGANRREN